MGASALPGRVAHVRQSVHGPKKMGRSPFERFWYLDKTVLQRDEPVAHRLKSFEKFIFGPCTPGRTWGTRPEPATVVAGVSVPNCGCSPHAKIVGVLVTPLDGSANPLGETRGRRLEMGWEIAIGGQAATSYLIRVVR